MCLLMRMVVAFLILLGYFNLFPELSYIEIDLYDLLYLHVAIIKILILINYISPVNLDVLLKKIHLELSNRLAFSETQIAPM